MEDILMNKKCFVVGIVMSPFLFSACHFKDLNLRNVLCENFFTLVGDFNHKFPEQGDYMLFIKCGYYETFYYKKHNGYNCHYHLEYKNGIILDEWGHYACDGDVLYMTYENIGEKRPYFVKYYSPTIDFHIIDTIEYEGEVFKIVYQARYLYSAKG